MSQEQHEHTTTNDGGSVRVDIEDAGGRELRAVDERPPDDEIEEIEEERERRLDPENRPADAEVDNTHRDFDADTGYFTGSDGHDESDAPYAGSDQED